MLPLGVVAVLHDRLRQRRQFSGGEGVIKGHELGEQYAVEGDPVEDEMVHRQIKAVMVVGKPNETRTQQRTVFEIVGTLGRFCCLSGGTVLRLGGRE